ncbi:LysE family translocator [Halopseudomonas sabulinigri]|uniref:LysE family translocator n=1 Tax=Halopseudomonas sabulinigri TaxID=472181 RepID=UPI003341555C
MLTLIGSMLAFSLVGSIAPGPVCVVAVAAGAQAGVWGAARYVLGASLGYTLMVFVVGVGLLGSLQDHPQLLRILSGLGAVYLLYLAWRLVSARGELPGSSAAAQVPGFWAGALAQWLNPKAWLFSTAGIGLFVSGSNAGEQALLLFCMLSLLMCLLGVGSWALAGHLLERQLPGLTAMRWFNRCMALLLVGSVAMILLY